MSRRKALGQHFLVNRSALQKIVDIIDPRQDELIIEIGPGRGALTLPLAEKAGKVVAVEKDPAFIPALRKRGLPNLTVVEADVLEVDFKKISDQEPAFRGRIKIAGNLPYSISSPLLFKVLDDCDLFTACVFLLQKEVAERIIARPGSKNYSPLSILYRIHFEPRIVLRLTPNSFSPPPRVESALLSLVKRDKPLVDFGDEAGFRAFLRSAFLQRRKTLANNLRAAGYETEKIAAAVERLGLDARIRAEDVDAARLKKLFDLLRPELRSAHGRRPVDQRNSA